MRNLIILVLVLFFGVACFEELPEQNKETENYHEVLVQEVIHAGTYTYLRVSEDKGENWLAVPKMETQPGEIFYYTVGLPMKNFKSRELNRTFPEVLFLEKVYKSPEEIKSGMKSPHSSQGRPVVAKKEIKVEPANGGITISELFANKSTYNGKKVKIRGEVTKFSSGILNKNWIHIQDGTEHEGKYDLVVTSNMRFKVGDVVTVEGKVTLDKDFGHGYFYEIIIEEADARVALN